jgi:hypothetical protein
MTKFRIDYLDPSTGQPASIMVEYEDIPSYVVRGPEGQALGHGFYSAKEQAWNFAYTFTDKGHFEVIELPA